MSPQAAIRKTEMKRTTDTRMGENERTARPGGRAGTAASALLVNCGGDDDAHSDRHGAYHDCQRHVVLFHDLGPQIVGCHLVDQGEGSDEDEDSENRID